MRLERMTPRRLVAGVAALALAVLTLVGCTPSPTPAQQDAARSQQNTGNMITNQPVVAGKYSPTREQINAWVRTWESGPGKIAYTYVFINGTPVGYYALKGPPVSYAQGATQPYSNEYLGSGGAIQNANPGQDGTWANQGTGQFQWYGIDATTGRILEVWGSQATLMISDQPLRLQAPPLGDSVIGQIPGQR